MEPKNKCQTCGKASMDLYKCARCLRTFYCNEECQRADWPNHKAICKKPDISSSSTSKKTENEDNEIKKAIIELGKCIDNDFLPNKNGMAYKWLGFQNAKSVEEESCILGLYTGIWNLWADKIVADATGLDPLYDTDKIKEEEWKNSDLKRIQILSKAIKENALIDFIENIYKQVKPEGSYYYTWFLANKDKLKH